MATPGEIKRKLWGRFIRPPQLTPTRLMRDVAWGLWLTPAIMLFPLLLPLLEPSSFPDLLEEHWDLYLLFFGLPWTAGILLWVCSRRMEHRF